MSAQDSLTIKRKLRFPAWITHSANKDIVGVSLAAFPKGVFKSDTTLTRTFGLRIEASLLAALSPLMPKSPVSESFENYKATQNSKLTEIIYGVNLSSGTFGSTRVNGISGGLFLQYLYSMNGVSFSPLGNLMEKHNGISLSILGNEAYIANGLFIGLGNLAVDFNGIEIGVINTVVGHGVGIQIGLFNEAKDFKGIQLGLWNKNEKRSLPFVNWNFKS